MIFVLNNDSKKYYKQLTGILLSLLFVLLTFLFVLLALLPGISNAKATNYDECILENISNAQTDTGVRAIKRACRSLFPAPNTDEFERLFTREALGLQAGEALTGGTVRKKFFLVSADTKWSNNQLVMELVNDTKFYIFDIIYRYKIGDCGTPTRAAVVIAQQKLNKKGFYAGSVDGSLGASTRDAIDKFQESLTNLKVTGKLDNQTLNALDINTELGWKSTTAVFPNSSIKQGSSADIKFYLESNNIRERCGHQFGWADVPTN